MRGTSYDKPTYEAKNGNPKETTFHKKMAVRIVHSLEMSQQEYLKIRKQHKDWQKQSEGS